VHVQRVLDNSVLRVSVLTVVWSKVEGANTAGPIWPRMFGPISGKFGFEGETFADLKTELFPPFLLHPEAWHTHCLP
jgi:hypothetical protein